MLKLCPGLKKLNLHASYAIFKDGAWADRDALDFAPWVKFCKARGLGRPCVMNIWTGDGFKDIPGDRMGPRKRYREAIDEILSERISASP